MRVTLYRARVSPSSPGSQIWTAASQMNLPTSVYPFTSNRSGPKIFLPSPAGCSPPRFTDCKPYGRADVEFFDIDGLVRPCPGHFDSAVADALHRELVVT